MTNDLDHLPPPPLALALADLLGGTFDGDVVHVGAHVIASRLNGRVVLDDGIELGWHGMGAGKLAAAFRAAVA